MDNELQRLRAACALANQNLQNHLKTVYPVGMRVGVRLKRGQFNPTWGVVFDYWGGNIQVHFDGARRPYRMIDPDDIMEFLYF